MQRDGIKSVGEPALFFTRICMSLIIVMLAFDFKGNEGASNTWQTFLLGSNIVLLFSAFVLLRAWEMPISPITWIGIVWFSGQVVNYIYRDRIAPVDILRWGFPFFALFIQGHLVQSAMMRGVKREWIMRQVMFAVLFSTYFSIYSALYLKGVSFSEMRYQILSPVLPVALAFAVGSLVYRGESIVLPLLIMLGTVFALLTAITRTTIFMAVGALVLLLFIGANGKKRIDLSVKNMSVLGLCVFLGLTAAIAVRPTLWDDWFGRLFSDSEHVSTNDEALMGRLVEYQGQMEYWGLSNLNKMIGMGVSHPYPSYDGEAVYTGHGLWVYSLFSSGIVFCWAIPSVFIYMLLQAYRNAVGYGDIMKKKHCAFIAVAAAVILIYSTTAHPLGSRFPGLLYGTLIGYIASLRYARDD